MNKRLRTGYKASFDVVGKYNQDQVNGIDDVLLYAMFDLMRLEEAASVLDAMAGDGNLSVKLIQYCAEKNIVQPSLTVLEYSKVQSEFARMHLSGKDAEVIWGDVLSMENLEDNSVITDSSFDRVMIKSAVHEISLDRQQNLYSSIFRVLKPGGLFVNLGFLFDDPLEREELRRIAAVKDKLAGMEQAVVERHFLTREELYLRLEQSGFKEIRCGKKFEYGIRSSIVARHYFSGAKSLEADLEHQAEQARAYNMRRNGRILFEREESLMICPGELTVASKPVEVTGKSENESKIFNDYPYDFLRHIKAHSEMLSAASETISDGEKVLDVCCGPGLLYEHLRLKNVEYTGIDLSDEFIGICKERYSNEQKTNFILSDVNSAPIPHSSFDAITILNALYLPQIDVRALLTRCLSGLKPGGRLIVSGPTSAESYKRAEPSIIEQLKKDGLLEGNEHLLEAIGAANQKLLKSTGNYWSAEGMIALLRAIGFTEVRSADTTLYYGSSYMVIGER